MTDGGPTPQPGPEALGEPGALSAPLPAPTRPPPAAPSTPPWAPRHSGCPRPARPLSTSTLEGRGLAAALRAPCRRPRPPHPPAPWPERAGAAPHLTSISSTAQTADAGPQVSRGYRGLEPGGHLNSSPGQGLRREESQLSLDGIGQGRLWKR